MPIVWHRTVEVEGQTPNNKQNTNKKRNETKQNCFGPGNRINQYPNFLPMYNTQYIRQNVLMCDVSKNNPIRYTTIIAEYQEGRSFPIHT